MTSRCAREKLATAHFLRRHVSPRATAFRCQVVVALTAAAMRLAAVFVDTSTSASALTLATGEQHTDAVRKDTPLDEELAALLASHAFTGRIAETLETRLQRRLDHRLADLG